MKKSLLLLFLCALQIMTAQTSGTAFKYLDINRVKAGIMNRGDMHWDIFGTGNASYEVPAGSNTHSGFAASLWIGGLDGSSQLHVAAQTYRQTGNDFWSGPLDTTNATTNASVTNSYDKIWKVSYNDINTFITQWNLGNVPTSYTPTPDIMSWPAAGTGNFTRQMAPFIDVNNNGIYDPLTGGDYPDIKGDEALYFIFNDAYQAHTETGGTALGIEVHAMAYAYGCPAVLNGRNELAYTTFYNYKVFNRSSNNYTNVYLGFWDDADLGCYLDDYIGSSVPDNLGFLYNATGIDQLSCSGTNAYGNYPPAIGTTVLKGPLANPGDGADNNNNGTIDEAGEQCLMNKFLYYNNNIGTFPPATTNPAAQNEYYGYLKGFWKDGSPFTCGGNAYGGSTPTDFVYPWITYPGNPCGSWTETSAGNLAGDRRYIVSTGPFNFGAKQMIEMEYAYVWSVDSSTANANLGSVNKLITDAGKVRTFYNSSVSNCLLSIVTDVKETQEQNTGSVVFPNPGHYLISAKAKREIKTIELSDVTGRTVMTMDQVNQLSTEFNVENLSNGVYFVKVSGQSWTNTTKLVKN